MMSCCSFFNIERFGSGSSSTFIVIISHSLSRIFSSEIRIFSFDNRTFSFNFSSDARLFSSTARSFAFVFWAEMSLYTFRCSINSTMFGSTVSFPFPLARSFFVLSRPGGRSGSRMLYSSSS
ncbi:hypothetical protein HanIR_Chr16g0818161 [Helianthus annuus]|nr:hypothetical protein HanIR_Chr16g0818161 [Helianthus annuus]